MLEIYTTIPWYTQLQYKIIPAIVVPVLNVPITGNCLYESEHQNIHHASLLNSYCRPKKKKSSVLCMQKGNILEIYVTFPWYTQLQC